MRMETPDMTEKNIDKIGELFPNCITESKDENGNLKKAINFDILKQMLSKEVIDGDEAYEFTWVGKKAAMLEANKPIRKTLRPCSEESVNWDTTENLYIEGDNLEVLKLLQESYLGKVKMIYIDPPYNTGNDFIYKDDFSQSVDEYEAESGQVDEEGTRLFKNSETNGRFHSDWCSMIYSRLMVARNLLSEDGVIFISIDDNEVENLKRLCDETFGETNFVATIPWRKRTAKSDVPFGISQDYEWIVVYAKSENFRASIEGGSRKYYETPDFPNRPWRIHDITCQRTASERPNSYFTMVNPKNGQEFPCNPNSVWRITKDTFQTYYDNNEIVFPGEYEFLKISKPVQRYFKDKDMQKDGENFGRIAVSTKLPDDIGMSQDGTKEIKSIFNSLPFSYPKSYKLLNYLIKISSDKDAIILDFFSGSATTAHAVMQLNAEDGGKRKFIMVQLQEPCDEKSEAYKAGFKNICEIGKERIRRAGKKILEEMSKNTPFDKGGCPQSGQGDFNSLNVDEKISPSALQAATPLYERGLDNGSNNASLDVGFRVFKLDDSNMKDVYYSADEYSQKTLSDLESNIKEDRTDLDLLFGCLLEWGLPLSMPYSSEKIEGFNVHTYNDGDLIACFDANIPESVIKEIAKRTPLRAVFRDSSFADSPSKINVSEIFKLISPNTKVKVI